MFNFFKIKSRDYETLLKRIMDLEADVEKISAKLVNEIFKFNALRGRIHKSIGDEKAEEEDLKTGVLLPDEKGINA